MDTFLLQIWTILKKVTEVEVCEILLTQSEFGLLQLDDEVKSVNKYFW